MREAHEKDVEAPSKWYLKTIIQGYRDFGLTQEEFEESLGAQQLGLTQKDLEERLGVSTDETPHGCFFPRRNLSCLSVIDPAPQITRFAYT